MPNVLIIEVLSDAVRPNPADVQQGDLVTFQLADDVQGTFEVSFDSADCFTAQGPFTLQSGSSLTSQSAHTVAASAAKGNYPYTVTPDEHTRKRFPQHETKRGDLDVTTDPPPPPKDKKPKKDK
ncbi:hypothetical protein [Archangium sp.]|uniref:hypothetical protein n=1 Tax=Archangium sp. TaxID=1872627 RepID=UPI00389A0398